MYNNYPYNQFHYNNQNSLQNHSCFDPFSYPQVGFQQHYLYSFQQDPIFQPQQHQSINQRRFINNNPQIDQFQPLNITQSNNFNPQYVQKAINEPNYPTCQAKKSQVPLVDQIHTNLNTKPTQTNTNSEVIQNLENYSTTVAEIFTEKNDFYENCNLNTDYGEIDNEENDLSEEDVDQESLNHENSLLEIDIADKLLNLKDINLSNEEINSNKRIEKGKVFNSYEEFLKEFEL